MYKEYDNNLPMKLKMLRMDAGLSQEEFAAKVGISRSCVANYETGKRRPDISMIRKIANVYSIMTDVLIGSDLYADIALHENNRGNDPKRKKSLQPYRNTLDISHFPAEYQISIIEYYRYIQSKHNKKGIKPAN